MKRITSLLSIATACASLAYLPSAQAVEPPACIQLTPAAFSSLITTLNASLAQATADCNAFCASGAYAVAAKYNRDYLVQVLANVNETKTWLETNNLALPYVTNASAAYNIHGLARDNIATLHHARHWATISAIYHKSSKARLSFDYTSAAITQLEALGENGGRCYVDQYAPFPN
jgi:enoyl-[acyl-carrier-protein] reductase (NADH)